MTDVRFKIEIKRALQVVAILVCFFAVSFLTVSLYDAIEKKRNPRPYFEYVNECSLEYGVPSELVYAVMLAESGFDRLAVSRSGACGLMQLMPSTFEWACESLGITCSPNDIFEPAANIRCGVWYLAYLCEKFGTWETAVAAYNAGEGRVVAWLADPALSVDGVSLSRIPYAETERYCKQVKNLRARYLRLYK